MSKQSWWLSDEFLGALVVLLTVATAFAAYQGALSGTEGDDLDFEAQRALTTATASFLNGNAEIMQDRQAYGAYRFFRGDDQAEASVHLERMSERLQEGLERPGGPFDDSFLTANYAEANEMLAQADELESRGTQVDDISRQYGLAGLIFSIGLAAAAWAALIGSGRRIRSVFLTLALVCMIAGSGAILRISIL